MQAASLLTALGFLAAFNEWALEALVGQWKAKLGWTMVYISAAVGVAECLVLGLNALPLAGIEGQAVLGQVITGIVVGSGSNALHKFFDKARGG